MKENLKVIFINELDLSIFDEYFYKVILRRILDLKQKKESQKINSEENQKFNNWDFNVCLS